jgi:hypothetical protein
MGNPVFIGCFVSDDNVKPVFIGYYIPCGAVHLKTVSLV